MWIGAIQAVVNGFQPQMLHVMDGAHGVSGITELSGVLHMGKRLSGSLRPSVTFRQVCLLYHSCRLLPNALLQAGDSGILVEYGQMRLDFILRARVHALESEVRKRNIKGIWAFAPCIRSTMVCLIPFWDVLIGTTAT